MFFKRKNKAESSLDKTVKQGLQASFDSGRKTAIYLAEALSDMDGVKKMNGPEALKFFVSTMRESAS